jgi:hypothetical protein
VLEILLDKCENGSPLQAQQFDQAAKQLSEVLLGASKWKEPLSSNPNYTIRLYWARAMLEIASHRTSLAQIYLEQALTLFESLPLGHSVYLPHWYVI